MSLAIRAVGSIALVADGILAFAFRAGWLPPGIPDGGLGLA